MSLAISTALSPSSANLATVPIPPSSTFGSTVNVVSNPSLEAGTKSAAEMILSSSDQESNEPAPRESTQDQRLSSYSADEKNDFKQDLSQHFKTNDIEESRTTTVTVLNDQGKHDSLTLDFTLKIEEARPRCQGPVLEMQRVQEAHSKPI